MRGLSCVSENVSMKYENFGFKFNFVNCIYFLRREVCVTGAIEQTTLKQETILDKFNVR